MYASNYGNRGLYTLTDVILPYFDSVQTVEDCYHSHKEGPYYKDPLLRDSHFSYSSREFVDEAIFVGDTEIFPDLLARANDAVDLCKRLTASKPDNKEYAQMIQHWQQIRAVFADGTREEYLQILQQRSMQNAAFMRKRLGLEIE